MKVIVDGLKVYPFQSFSDASVFCNQYHPEAEVVTLKGHDDLFILKGEFQKNRIEYFDTQGYFTSKEFLH